MHPWRRTLGPSLVAFLALSAGAASAHQGETLSRRLEERWRWVHFTTWSGLPSDDVLAVTADTEGRPWIATASGIAWYDGHRWQAFGESEGLPAKAAQLLVPLPGARMAAVVESALWIGGPAGFRRVLTPSGRVHGVAGLRDGSLFVAVDGQVHRLGPDGRATRLFEDRRPGWVRRLSSGLTGRALLTTWEGLWHHDDSGWREVVRFTEPGIEAADITEAFETAPGRGLVTVTQPHPLQGAWWWSRDGSLRRASLDGSEAVVSAAAHGEQALAVAYESGALGLRDLEEAEWRRASIPPAIGGVSCLLFGEAGDLWAGTARGLWLFRSSSERWSALGPEGDGDVAVVHVVHAGSDGRLWLGTRAGLAIRATDGSYELLREIEGTPIPVVTTVAEDGGGNIWIGSGSGFDGVWRFADGRWQHLGPEDGLHAPRVHAVRIDRSGRPWLLGLSRHAIIGGPGAFVFEDGRFRHVSLPGGSDSQRVYDLAEASDGSLWFGTNGGLHRLRDGRWDSWTVEDGLPENRVFTLELDSEDRPWFSSGHDGACRLDAGGQVTCESTEQGLPNGAVFDLAFDRSGALWASTRGGLGVRRDGAWSRILPHHGLPILRLWPVLEHEGSLLVGTSGRGLVGLDLSVADVPPPRVTLLRADASTDLTRLAWRTNAWWGEQGEREAETRWRLDDGPWSGWDRHEELALPDLSAGDHLLEVESKGLFGQRPPEPARFELAVPAPQWARPEVVGPVLLLFLALAGWVGFGFLRRRAFARELALREERFREILDNAGDVVFTAALDGRLTMLNRAGRELAGMGDRDATELDWYAFLGPEARERAASALRRKHGGEASSTYEVEVDPPGGERRLLEVHSKLVRKPGRKPEIHGVARDVTQRRRMETELRHSQKLESLGLLAGGVAHDFNNLLHAILGNLELARGAWREGRSPAGAMDDLESAAERATDLARVMLAYSGKARFEIRSLDLTELTEEILRLLRSSLPKNLEFETELDGELPAVEGERAQLQQVVLNLVTNAADALGEAGGRIRIRTGCGPAGEARVGEAVLDSELGERVVWLEVRDEGPGIDAATRARIFDPFFSTKGPGRGLGLSAVLGIVRVHGGALLLDHPAEGGACFRVCLTAVGGPVEPERRKGGTQAARPVDELQDLTVLVVDDEERVREVACRLLERLGCRTLEAADGLEAQDRAREQGDRLDVVLLDLVMPRCGGPEALEALRRLQPELPVVLTSGYSEAEGPAREVGTGAAGFLKKPYRLHELEAAMRQALRQRQRSGQ